MIIAMIVISAVVLAVCVSVAFVRLRRQRTPSELHGNWWADFERQFRAYDREARRHRRARRDDDPAKRPPTN
jgi:hypothetical protein